ncbi:MAG: type VI secretion system baseplate subunit TssG [Planctomycetota bacterium]|nr:type VI secretion system baseplate subunit TssG [Planctomycetota bacterium]
MATESRKQTTPLIESIVSAPGRFDFHQAVRLIELQGLIEGSKEPVGVSTAPKHEAVSLRVHPSLAYASAAIRASKAGDDDGEPLAQLDVTFAGLIGAAGVLPPHYSELVHARQQERDTSFRDFLDVLHRRTLGLFHRAWRRSHFPFAFELESRHRWEHDAFTSALLSLTGLGAPSLRKSQAVNDLTFAFSVGSCANQVKSAAALERTLGATFNVTFRVQQFIGSWLELPDDSRSSLLTKTEAGAARHALGQGLTLGSRAWNVQSKIRLLIGPLDFSQFNFFANEDPGRIRVMSLVRAFVGDLIEADIECVLAANESPGISLDGQRRLGVDSWLEASPLPPEPRKARFNLTCN